MSDMENEIMQKSGIDISKNKEKDSAELSAHSPITRQDTPDIRDT